MFDLYLEPFNLDVELLFIFGPAKLYLNLKTILMQKNFPQTQIQPKGEVKWLNLNHKIQK